MTIQNKDSRDYISMGMQWQGQYNFQFESSTSDEIKDYISMVNLFSVPFLGDLGWDKKAANCFNAYFLMSCTFSPPWKIICYVYVKCSILSCIITHITNKDARCIRSWEGSCITNKDARCIRSWDWSCIKWF